MQDTLIWPNGVQIREVPPWGNNTYHNGGLSLNIQSAASQALV